jgi:HAD superfamily hydrolase (TIGR01459 family)
LNAAPGGTACPPGLGAVIGDIGLVVMDLWGCMHDGVSCYPAALACLRELKQRAIPVALVSNAPRRASAVVPRLEALGLGAGLYARLYTSGEETWNHIARRDRDGYRDLGRRSYAILSEHDRDFLEGLGLTLSSDVSDADFVLVLGIGSLQDRVSDFDRLLGAALARDLPLVCANPDLMVHRGGVAEICAGAIAAEYARRGGRVIIEGKPHPAIYRRVLADFGISDPRRMLCVGDSLRTDIAGAAGVGACSLLVAGGIHHAELLRDGVLDPAALARLVAQGPHPDFALAYLGW